MTYIEWLKTLSKDDLIIMIQNQKYQLELAEDKVEYLTGCRAFGESDGMNGACVDCYYNYPFLWKKCFPFNTIFWPWHCKKSKERQEHENEKDYEKPVIF